MGEHLLKYFSVFLGSMFKFIFGPATGIASGLSVFETVLFTVLGMMSSVVIFSILGQQIKKKWFKKYFAGKKTFTRRNRRMVTIWKKYGIQGVAFLTPLILSPIVGTMVAVSFGENRFRIWVYMFFSALFWSIVFSFLLGKVGLQMLYS